MEGVEKGKTAKYLRQKKGVPAHATENLKEYTKIKRKITEALADGELTIKQVADKVEMSYSDAHYYMMTLLKYGILKTGQIDDMDEYFTYKQNK
ncbi:MAG: hypothetical protein ACK5KP_05705 [Paludibacteraceae bacterium]